MKTIPEIGQKVIIARLDEVIKWGGDCYIEQKRLKNANIILTVTRVITGRRPSANYTVSPYFFCHESGYGFPVNDVEPHPYSAIKIKTELRRL